MDLKLFEAFRAVLEEGTMVRAAGRLRLSQPTVSKSIDALERSVGCVLFRREGRRLAPTPEALALYAEVSRAMQAVDHLPGIARALRLPTHGTLGIGANPTLSSGFIQRLIRIFVAEYPGVTIRLQCDTGRNLIQAKLAGSLDVFFSTRSDREGLTRVATVATTPLATGRMVCVLPAGHALAARSVIEARDLDGAPFIALVTAPEAREMLDRMFAAAGVAPAIVAEASTAPAACHLAAAGLGATLVGSLTAWTISAADTPAMAIRPFLPDMRYTIEYTTSSAAEKSPLASAFVRIAREHGPAVLGALTGEQDTSVSMQEQAAPAAARRGSK
jgi:DNA-binding transcriptional LysR family regulator